jgi:deoxyribodipyrimidine photolyase
MNLSSRVTQLNQFKLNTKGRYVLYWMQMFKRASHNYALNFAIQMANEHQLPLVVYEGLKFYYPWANDRIHTFILEGVVEKQAEFSERGIRYIFYLQRNSAIHGIQSRSWRVRLHWWLRMIIHVSSSPNTMNGSLS